MNDLVSCIEVDRLLGLVAFFAGLIAVIFPNFQLFNVTDGLTAGEVVSTSLMARLVGLTAFYLTIYSLVSWLVFAKKEL